MIGASPSVPEPNHGDLIIRPVRIEDQVAIEGIFSEDTIGGGFNLQETATLVSTYESNPDSRLWVAEIGDAGPVGVVGVWHADDHVAELRRLRVLRQYRKRGIGRRLVETALGHCRERAYLKIILDTDVNRAAAIALFEAFGFELTRTRDVDGRKLHDFYLNLYRDVSDQN